MKISLNVSKSFLNCSFVSAKPSLPIPIAPAKLPFLASFIIFKISVTTLPKNLNPAIVVNIAALTVFIDISIDLNNISKSFCELNKLENTCIRLFNTGNNASASCFLNPSNLIANTAIWSLKNSAFCANSSDTA